MAKIGDRHIEVTPDYEVIRAIIDHQCSYAAWIGAGASVEAKIKTGRQICDELRKEMASYAHPKDEDAWAEEQLNWSDLKRRYSTCLKRYGSAEQRVRYFRQLIKGLPPAFSHHALALLMQSGVLARTCLTTNFDKLIEIAFAQQGNSECQAIRGDEEAGLWRQEDDKCYVVKLHGDYDTHNLLNTTDETVRIPDLLARLTGDVAKQRGFVIVGSSGYEESVIRLLNDLVDSDDPTTLTMGLYWGVNVGDAQTAESISQDDAEKLVGAKLRAGSVSQEVLDLMNVMRERGRQVPRAFFPVFGAREFFRRLIKATANKALIGRMSRYFDYEMRLRLNLSRGGLTPEAIQKRLTKLAGKASERNSPAKLLTRSLSPTKVWTATGKTCAMQAEIAYGDITSRSMMGTSEGEVRQAVISPEDTMISAGGGVALALLHKAGQQIVLNELSKFPHVNHRDVVVTSGGELPVNYIFHCAATALDRDGKSSITPADIEATLGTALHLATELGVGCIFLPLIGAGTEGMDPGESLDAILRALKAFAASAPACRMALRIVIREEGTLTRREVGAHLAAVLGPDFECVPALAEMSSAAGEM